MGDAVCSPSVHAEGMTNTNDQRWENLRAGSETAKHLPCSVCGEPVPIPAKYARAKSATCGQCQIKQVRKGDQVPKGGF